jgi:hypothetical protein
MGLSIDRLGRRLAAVRELVAVKWEADLALYPDSRPGELAAAVVRCCQREVLEVLNETGSHD